jgi:tetratricopeptide (TPR) repeat protein
MAQQQTRFVLITGSRDMNHDSVVGTYQRGFLVDGFQHVELFDVPDMGHGLPPVDYMDKAIDALDAPLPAIADKGFDRARELAKTKKFEPAIALFKTASLHGTGNVAAEAQTQIDWIQGQLAEKKPSVFDNPPAGAALFRGSTSAPATAPAVVDSETLAQGLLSLAHNYERTRLYPQARERAERIIKQYPNSQAAAEAKTLLDRLKGK